MANRASSILNVRLPGEDVIMNIKKHVDRALDVIRDILVPPGHAGRGAVAGAVLSLALLLLYVVPALVFQHPAGLLLAIPVVVIAVIVSALAAVLVYGLHQLLSSRYVAVLVGVIIGAGVLLAIVGPYTMMAASVLFPVFPYAMILGAVIGAVYAVRRYPSAKWKTLTMCSTLVLLLLTGVISVTWYFSDGSDRYLADSVAVAPSPMSAIDLPDPSIPGPYPVATMYYGSGTDARRAEFGVDTDVITHQVDITPFLPEDFSSFRMRLRDWYWGFSMDESPLNGRVWFPEAAGEFPLVLIVHGNHDMSDYSDTGYGYLGELLASRGFITVSVDQNFLNGSRFAGEFGGRANVARAWNLLEHLALWRQWQGDNSSPFYGRVDMDNIALIGHSRGGEAISIAAALNPLSHFPDDGQILFGYNFNIRSLIAIAPTDEFYKPAGRSVGLQDINYLLLHGGHDGDLSVFMGNAQYQRAHFSGQQYGFKSALYIYQANHGQFNTGWGRRDLPAPVGRLLNLKPLMEMDEQLQIAKVTMSAFLEATLKQEQGYVGLFRDIRTGNSWLPETIIVNRFQDSGFRVVSDFEEDLDIVTTTVPGGTQMAENFTLWKEDMLSFRVDGMVQGNNVLQLAWDQNEQLGTPEYTITLPPGLADEWQLGADDLLTFSMADMGQGVDPLTDVTLVLTAGNGVQVEYPLSRAAPIRPPLVVRYTKLGFIEPMLIDPVEPALLTYQLPLVLFTEVDLRFDPAALNRLSFRFEHSPRGQVALDDIGFHSP